MVNRVLGAMTLVCALLFAPLTSQAVAPTEGQEVEPTTVLDLTQITVFHGPQNTQQAFWCTVFSYETPSSIDCESHSGNGWHVEARVELVGIWHSGSSVNSHRVFMTREARGATYHYEGVLSQGGVVDNRWMSGSYTVTQRKWKRSGWRWYQVTVTNGPYPFTAGLYWFYSG